MKRKNTRIRYCYRSPLFPKTAFIAFMGLTSPVHTALGLYPMPRIYTDINDAREDVLDHNGTLNQGVTNLTVSDTGFIMPITMVRKIPLKKEYWFSSIGLYSQEHRAQLFSEMTTKWLLYSILVTPYRLRKTYEEFSATAAFRRTVTDREIAQFMLSSDFTLDESAKYAALYAPDRPLIVNWTTGEIIPARPSENASAVH